MAVVYLPLFGANAMPDATGNAFFEPYSIKASNDLSNHQVLILNDAAADCGIDGAGTVPDISSIVSVRAVAYWNINATTGNIELEFSYRAIASGEGGDPSTWQQANVSTGAVAVPGTAFNITRTTITLTAGNFAVDDLVYFNFIRDNDGGNDTAAAAIIVHRAYIEFEDS